MKVRWNVLKFVQTWRLTCNENFEAIFMNKVLFFKMAPLLQLFHGFFKPLFDFLQVSSLSEQWDRWKGGNRRRACFGRDDGNDIEYDRNNTILGPFLDVNRLCFPFLGLSSLILAFGQSISAQQCRYFFNGLFQKLYENLWFRLYFPYIRTLLREGRDWFLNGYLSSSDIHIKIQYIYNTHVITYQQSKSKFWT